MSITDNCIFTYPNITNVAAGQKLPFSIETPSTIVNVTSTLIASSVYWTFTDGAGTTLIPGQDYIITNGDAVSSAITVVFKPVDGRTVNVIPQVNLFKQGTVSPETGSFTRQLTLQGIGSFDYAGLLKSALTLTTKSNVVDAGRLAEFQILPAEQTNAAQTVTSIVQETPEVKIKGALSVDSIVEAFLSPVTGALGQIAPSLTNRFSQASDQIEQLLASAFSIPISIDFVGKRISKTLTPDGTQMIPSLTFSPDGQSLSGAIPIGSWPAKFTCTNVTWTIQKSDGSQSITRDLTTGANFVKSFFILPDLVDPPTAGSPLVPRSIQVTVSAKITLEEFATNTTMTLGPLPLLLMPVAIPQLAVIFYNSLTDLDANSDDQKIFITTNARGAPFFESLQTCLKFITQLAGILNCITSNIIGFTNTSLQPYVDVSRALSLIADKISKTPLERGSF